MSKLGEWECRLKILALENELRKLQGGRTDALLSADRALTPEEAADWRALAASLDGVEHSYVAEIEVLRAMLEAL